MGYFFQQSESPAIAVRRIAFEEIDKAINELESSTLSNHEIVHQVRKRCKKMRGLLRLVRSCAGPMYQKENAWFRDSAQALSPFRDAQTLIESCDKLLNHYSDAVHTGSFAELEYRLGLFRDELAAEQGDLESGLIEFRQRMLQAKGRVEDWPLREDGFELIVEGFANTYQHGRRALKRAYREPKPENFHEWRKQVKYHWFQIRLLKNLWPELLEARSKELKKLSESLGDDHDLTVLENYLLEKPDKFGSEKMIDAFIGLLRQRQEHLREAARPLGRRLFAEKTSSCVQRFDCLWHVWKE